MAKLSAYLRSAVLAAIVIVASFMCGLRLLQIQIADGEKYLAMTKQTYTAEQSIEAARGRISDRNGVVLNTNELCYSVNLQMASLIPGTENEVIYRVLTVLIKNGDKWNDSLPITEQQPYRFLNGKDAQIDTLRSELELGVYATVDNCINEMYKKYDISDKYDEQMRRYIAGVRYEMQIKDFSYKNQFVMASGISEKTVVELKELYSLINGVDITEGWSRVYLDGTLAPHIRGTVGAISAEQYAELQNSGYTLNDVIGLSGVELALEETLRGERGTRTIVRSSDGTELSDEITVDPKAGMSVRLTIDSKLQQNVQDIIKYHIDFLHSPHYTQNEDGKECASGAAVVLDVKTGGVLAMVSYPGYDINDLVNNYEAVLSAEDQPIFNRALNGTYRPGSTFKTVTATAALAEGIVTPDSTINCTGTYTFYAPGFTPHCWQRYGHGPLNVKGALRDSCNIFFYETARIMGIDRLAYWANRLGIGTDLGFELPMQNGQMTSHELYDRLGLTWNEGDIVQAGIGQSETLLTPLHMAVQAMTIGNRGIRYKPHIVDAVYNYDYTELIQKIEPEIADDISDYADVFESVIDGMIMVSEWGFFSFDDKYVNIYEYKGADPSNVATKTGTPQKSETVFSSAVIGFYPADDPEISFGIILDEGEYSRIVAANIIGAYLTGEFEQVYDEEGFASRPL
ncbi:MAG: peptidoglycan D,D-transpeptidase FtsI family protein [Oscillospiraceae bacterium]